MPTSEMNEDQIKHADFRYAYDEMIRIARSGLRVALAPPREVTEVGQPERNMEIDAYRWELRFRDVRNPMALALETLEMIALRCEDMATFADEPEGYRGGGFLRASAKRVRATTEKIRELNSAALNAPKQPF